MTDFLNKISLYEQLGYIVVGGLFYAFFSYDLAYFSIDISKLIKDNFSIAISVYFLGHLAQAVANQLIKEKKGTFTPEQNEILNKVRDAFKIPNASSGEAFGACYMWALGNDKTGHVSVMNANYGLYRGWTIVLGLQTIFYSLLLIWEGFHCSFRGTNLLGLSLTCVFAILMFKRSKRFYSYISNKTFQTFIIGYKKE